MARLCVGRFETYSGNHARVAQLVEHLVEAQSVGGSIPSPCTKILHTGIAQLVRAIG